MPFKSNRKFRIAFFMFASLFFVSAAMAGPPLICHPFDIGNARSLPWISHDWNLTGGEGYDTANLAADTLAILNSSEVTLVHMETLRRATLFARSDRVAAKRLLLQLVARAESSGASQNPNAFAMFDAAYLAETYKQWLGEDNPAKSLESYAWLKRAMQVRGNDPQMAFAAALITLRGPQTEHRQYADAALAGAKSDPLLARNLSSHFLSGPTMAQFIQPDSQEKVAKQ
jgi:hypothetical protein